MTKIGKYAAIAVVCALFVFYAVYQYYISGKNHVTTEMAYVSTLEDTIDTIGYTVRDETYIYSGTGGGVLVAKVPDGSKVSSGEAVADIFTSIEAANAHRRMAQIDKEIAEFRNMATAMDDASTAENLKAQINDRLIRLSRAVSVGDLNTASSLRTELLYLMNKRQVAMMEVDGFDDRIAELWAEREALANQYPETPAQIKSPFSGYYIDTVDGYESLFSTSILLGLTPEGLDNIISSEVIIDPAVVGKVSNDFRWYIVCSVAGGRGEELTVGGTYTLILPYSDTGSIRADLIRITPGEDPSRSLAEFQCTNTIPELASVREQPVTIQIKQARGLCVPTSAIHTRIVSGSDEDGTETEEEQSGVYVLFERRIRFRRIDIIAQFGHTTVCRINDGSGFLKRYDKVVVEGDDLYDEKLVSGG